MAVDVEGWIPPELMKAERVHEVVALIRATSLRPSVKRQILGRWALIVGADVPSELLVYVQGIDRK